MICPNCGKKVKRDEILFSISTKPPKIEWFCPHCRVLLTNNPKEMERLLKKGNRRNNGS